MAGLVTQATAEYADTGAPAARITAAAVDYADTGAPLARVTQVVIEYIDGPAAGGAASTSLLTFVGP